MENFNYPAESAFKIAQTLKKFRAQTENHAYSEVNPRAEMERCEVVRQINWGAYNELIAQLEFTYKNK